MNVNVSGHHLVVTPAINAYVVEKMDKIRRHFDHVIDLSVMLSVEKLVQKAEVTLHVRGKDMHAEASDDNLYAAIDMLVDKLDRQILRHKDKTRNHAHTSLKHQALAE